MKDNGALTLILYSLSPCSVLPLAYVACPPGHREVCEEIEELPQCLLAWSNELVIS